MKHDLGSREKERKRVKECNGRNKKTIRGLFQLCVNSRQKQGGEGVVRDGVELREHCMRNT